MMFTGIEIWFFLPAVLAIHWLLPRRAAVQNGFLLAASYLFFATWSFRLLPLLLSATAIDYVIARVIDRNRERPKLMRWALTLSIVYNVAQLGYFKYAGILGFGGVSVILPLGISFWTMTKMGYVLDVYYGRIEACRSPLTFATFVGFFPQLIAGPIGRASELLPQYAEPRRLKVAQISNGAVAFLLGYALKAMIGDWLNVAILDRGWAEAATHSTAGHWALLFLYAVQIFSDFAGYSVMAIGVGQLLGIELPVNFRRPFLARNMVDFWRRWHISLNQWLFEYIYGPLTTGEGWFRGKLRAGFVLVFLISGVWHGARANFVVWGLAHGLALVAWQTWDTYYKTLCRKDRKWVARRKSAPYQVAAWASTLLFFCLTLVLFRASSLHEAGEWFRALFVPQGGDFLPDYHAVTMRGETLAVCLAAVLAYHLLELPRGQAVREKLFAAPAVVRGVFYGLVIVYLLLFMPISASAFVYGAF